MKKFRLIILVSAMIFAAACQSNTNRRGDTGSESRDQSEQPIAKGNYTCPMHPEVTSDHPGECPKCGMELVLADSVDASGSDTLSL
ncbi:MAG TPA: heavy metal-binding domain-containing protein [Bacteroidales bacterium]|nr:heavy metal-binding domain-containing protein [Bacteroidales bacterium]